MMPGDDGRTPDTAANLLPEAVDHAGPAIGLACVVGFIASFLLSMSGGL